MAEVNENNNVTEGQAAVSPRESRSIREVQQSFAESLGYSDQIIWDLLSANQPRILKNKLKALIPDPTVPENLDEDNTTAAEAEVRRQCNKNASLRQTLFDSVWEQRKYSNRQSLSTIIYVLVATGETDHNIAHNSKKWSCHPVFRVRRCMQSGTSNNDGSNNSADCCMIFVDENGRVYQNWRSYLADNELPVGIMVAPCRGIYNLDDRRDVLLEKWLTPAGTTGRKMLGALDVTTAVTGFAAACVPVAAFLTLPVSAPLMAAAGIVGLASAGYSTARSGAQLVDRNQHEQSINVTNRAARGHWLGVLAGAVGLGAAGATSAMTAATHAGREVGAITHLAVNSMNISSIMISGSGVANGILELILKYQDGDNITAMDALQLSASLVLFTHSVYNFKLASTIISETSNSRIGSYRETLSNRQRRMFDKLTKETIRTRGATRGRVDIIRNVNDMPSRQEFNDLYKINRQLNEQNVRPAFAAEGTGILLNDQVVTNGADLRANLQHNIGPDILGRVTQPIPETSSAGNRLGGGNGRSFTNLTRLIGPSPQSFDTADAANNNYAVGVAALRLSAVVVNGVIITLSDFGNRLFERIIDAESFETVLLSLADNMSEDIFNFVLSLTETFMNTMWDELHNVLKFFITSESVLYRLGMQILYKYRGYTLTQLNEVTHLILNSVRAYFMSLNPNAFPELLTKCNVCSGYFNICQL